MTKTKPYDITAATLLSFERRFGDYFQCTGCSGKFKVGDKVQPRKRGRGPNSDLPMSKWYHRECWEAGFISVQ